MKKKEVIAENGTKEYQKQDMPKRMRDFNDYLNDVSSDNNGNYVFIDDNISSMEAEKQKRINALKEIYGCSDKEAEKADSYLMLEFSSAARSQELPILNLPERPKREIRNRENIIDYLRDDEGFGPWLAANALTRPLLRELSPKADMALSNWLRKNKLPEDIRIPTKSEVLSQKQRVLSETDQAAARRAAAARMYTLRHSQPKNK
ncbi:hypothetical protein M2352_003699 [Azospirillum fermentarium]|uniref:hypothetical protein n=1 Tax=Azospirillum fermentarium TaxID=1233114 RepID=UPI0022266576|nr:hypothetical protein [Azospirillum fermentarium]MCW2248065.1 hypothetical protein [Azospirillum fermentarium]